MTVIEFTVMPRKEPRWTLGELCARVALALSRGYDGQSNGQVRDIPDARTIRYYTALGLVGRPAAMRGRTALYGRRHLLELVAVKRLQARGLPLSRIQGEIAGLPDRSLERVAAIPAGVEEELARDGAGEAGEEPAPARASSFWKDPPAVPAAAGPARHEAAGLPAGETARIRTVRIIDLAPGAGIVLDGARPVASIDLEALREAAAPLLEVLKSRGLLPEELEKEEP